MLERLSRTVAAAEAGMPFLGGKALERRRGRPFRARLGANECLFEVSSEVRAAWRDGLAGVGFYTDPTHHELREAIAARWQVPMERICVSQGIDGLLELLVRSFVEPGDAVVTSLGAYPTFDYHARGYGARILHRPYRSEGTNDLAGLLALAHAHDAKLLFLANPDNPTGSLQEPGVLLPFIDALPRGCLLLLDEAYAEFAPPGGILPLTLARANVVRLRTFSKAFGLAGARVGYMVGAENLMERMDRIRQHFGVARMSQELALAAARDLPHLERIVAWTREANAHYAAIARALGIATLESHANFVAFDFGDPRSAAEMASWLDRHDVFVRRPTSAPLDRLIRITAAPRPARDYLAQVLRAGMRDRAAPVTTAELHSGPAGGTLS